MMVAISRAPSSVVRTVPRLLELSTMPGTVMLQLRTLLGTRALNRAKRAPASAEKTCAGGGASSSSRRMSGSAVTYSLRSAAASSATTRSTCSTSAVRSARTTCASAGMALFWAPPWGSATLTSAVSRMALRVRASTNTALARSRWMSNSQCPPTRPRTLSRRVAVCVPGTGSHWAGRSTVKVMSPLQPARISLSVIQLKSIIRRPARRVVSNCAAPTLPFSSIAVSTASRGGCGMSSEPSSAMM